MAAQLHASHYAIVKAVRVSAELPQGSICLYDQDPPRLILQVESTTSEPALIPFDLDAPSARIVKLARELTSIYNPMEAI